MICNAVWFQGTKRKSYMCAECGAFVFVSTQNQEEIKKLACRECEHVGRWITQQDNVMEEKSEDDLSFHVKDRSQEILLSREHEEEWLQEDKIETEQKKPTFTKLFGSTRRLKQYVVLLGSRRENIKCITRSYEEA